MSFYIPKQRFLFGNKIIATVPSKLLHVKDNHYSIQFYDLESVQKFTKEEFEKYFTPYTPTPDLLRDFEMESYSKNKILKLAGEIPESMKDAIEKIIQDAYSAPGNTKNCTIDTYKKVLENASGLKKLASFKPQFNRRARNTYVIPAGFDELAFQKDPLPIGIDQQEFASKEEQNKICRQLLFQLFSFEGAPPMPSELQQYLEIKTAPVAGSHLCSYCCQPMKISEIKQEYKAKEHYMNLCHNEPEKGTRADNLYLGHTSCNREQGGFSMFQRILQNFELCQRTGKQLTPEQKQQLRTMLPQIQESLR